MAATAYDAMQLAATLVAILLTTQEGADLRSHFVAPDVIATCSTGQVLVLWRGSAGWATHLNYNHSITGTAAPTTPENGQHSWQCQQIAVGSVVLKACLDVAAGSVDVAGQRFDLRNSNVFQVTASTPRLMSRHGWYQCRRAALR